MKQYHLDYGSGTIFIEAENFEDALKKLNNELNTKYTEDNIRIKSVIAINKKSV